MPEHQQSYGTEIRWHIGRRVRTNAEELKMHLEDRLESDVECLAEKYGLYIVGGKEPLG